MATIKSISEAQKLHGTPITIDGKEKVYMYGLRVSNSMKLAGLGRHANFGNPFMVTKVADALQKKFKRTYHGYGTEEEVSKKFIRWIKGEVFQDVQPKRRKWLYDLVHTKNVLDIEFLYYQDSEFSHIKSLEEYIKYLHTPY